MYQYIGTGDNHDVCLKSEDGVLILVSEERFQRLQSEGMVTVHEVKPRKFKNLSLETLVRKIIIHGYMIGYRENPIDLESDEYYQELFAEIKARIEEGGDKNEY